MRNSETRYVPVTSDTQDGRPRITVIITDKNTAESASPVFQSRIYSIIAQKKASHSGKRIST
jgi:hypothetical protein